jgi:Domain of unknown function (DUF4160)
VPLAAFCFYLHYLGFSFKKNRRVTIWETLILPYNEWIQANTMPTVLRIGSNRFHFYSDERNEPSHIHIETPEGECKFWLNPIRLAGNRGVNPFMIRKIEKLVYENHELLMKKYGEFHGR